MKKIFPLVMMLAVAAFGMTSCSQVSDKKQHEMKHDTLLNGVDKTGEGTTGKTGNDAAAFSLLRS